MKFDLDWMVANIRDMAALASEARLEKTNEALIKAYRVAMYEVREARDAIAASERTTLDS